MVYYQISCVTFTSWLSRTPHSIYIAYSDACPYTPVARITFIYCTALESGAQDCYIAICRVIQATTVNNYRNDTESHALLSEQGSFLCKCLAYVHRLGWCQSTCRCSDMSSPYHPQASVGTLHYRNSWPQNQWSWS